MARVPLLDQGEFIPIVKGGFWISVSQLFNGIAALLLTILLSTYLAPSAFGKFKYVLSLAATINILTLNGMNTAITQAVARGFEGGFVKAVLAQLRWGVMAALVSLLLGYWYWQQDETELALLLIIAGIILPVSSSANTYKAVYLGRQNLKTFSLLSILNTLVFFGATILAVAAKRSFGEILIVYLVSGFLINLVLLVFTLKFARLNTREDRQLINYGKHLSVVSGVSNLSNNIDSVIIFHLFGSTSLASYILALAIPEQIRSFLRLVPAIALPKFSQLAKSKIKRATNYSLVVYSLFLALIVLLYIILAPNLILFLFPNYLGVVGLVGLGAFLIFGALSDHLDSVLSSRKAVKQIYLTGVTRPLIQVLLIFVLGISFGVTGMIIARIVSTTFVTAYQYFLLNRIVAFEKTSQRNQPVEG